MPSPHICGLSRVTEDVKGRGTRALFQRGQCSRGQSEGLGGAGPATVPGRSGADQADVRLVPSSSPGAQGTASLLWPGCFSIGFPFTETTPCGEAARPPCSRPWIPGAQPGKLLESIPFQSIEKHYFSEDLSALSLLSANVRSTTERPRETPPWGAGQAQAGWGA